MPMGAILHAGGAPPSSQLCGAFPGAFSAPRRLYALAASCDPRPISNQSLFTDIDKENKRLIYIIIYSYLNTYIVYVYIDTDIDE